MHKILFVDDEAVLLDFYESYFKYREGWEASLCSDPLSVEEILRDKEIDIVVSDLNMPQINGAELLATIGKNFPWVIRIILTSESNNTLSLRAVKYAHRCLEKPVNMAEIESEIENAYLIYKSEISRIVRTILTGLDSIPVMPKVYSELVSEIKKGDEASLHRIGNLVSEDPGMSLNVLRVVNSPYFGSELTINKPEHAVTMLGLNIVKNLILTAELIDLFPLSPENSSMIDDIINHSTLCSHLMTIIFEVEELKGKVSKEDVEIAGAIGMFHDVGKIVLASVFPKLYQKVATINHISDENLSSIEWRHLGVSHAEVGAYLMSLWGLSSKVAKAISKHCNASDEQKERDIFLQAINYANYIAFHYKYNGIKNLNDDEFLNKNKEWFAVVLKYLKSLEN